MNCKFITKNKKKCKNKCIDGLNFCHLKSHNQDKKLYNKILKKKNKDFEKISISKDNFNIIDVDRDGACLFSCLSYFILENAELFRKYKCYDILPEKIEDDDDINESIVKMAKFIQKELKNWCYENKNVKVPYYGGIILQDWILLVHGEAGFNSIDEYNKYFDIYAGDLDIYEIENNGEITTIEIPERWGTIVELYAFHKIYNININVYVLKKFDKTKFKVVNCTKRSKYARFVLRESIKDSKNKSEINLYFNDSYNTYHYEYLE